MSPNSEKPSFLRFFAPDPELANLSLRERWRVSREKMKKDGQGAQFVMVS